MGDVKNIYWKVIQIWLFWQSILFQILTLSIRLSMLIVVTSTCLQVCPHIMQLWCLSKCKLLTFCSFQSFTLQWGYSIPWGSCADQLQPVDSTSSNVYLLLNINNKAVFGTVNSTNGSWLTSAFVSTESWTWISFIKLTTTYTVLGFQDSTLSYFKVYYGSSGFSTYVLTSAIKLYGLAQSSVYSSV